MPSQYEVVLLGDYYVDLIFTGLPDVPRLSADLYATEFDFVPGGNYRTAFALTRLGLHTGWLCDFGDDLFSRFVLEMAERDGLETGLFSHHPFPLRRVSASFSFVHDRGFISFADPVDLRSAAAVVEQCQPRAVLVPSLSYDEAQAALATSTHAKGGLLYMDCQHDAATLATPGVREALSRVDVFAPNESEALHLTGASTVEVALTELSHHVPLVIIKRGLHGALAQAGGQVLEAPALEVTVCDTTGAGDCFNAGFLYGHLRGYSLLDCLRIGNICGGLAVETRGKATLPSAGEVGEMLVCYPNRYRC